MELNKDLQIFIEKTQEFYDKINNEIHQDVISFCRHCSVQGLLCGIPEMTKEEKERLISIRDSVKEVQDMLEFLQKLELFHQGNIRSALARLDHSRTYLIERITHYPNHDRKLEVLEDLLACFGDWNVIKTNKQKKKIIEQKVENRASNFLVTCIMSLFNPRNWYTITHIAMKVLVISAGVSSTVYIHRTMIDSQYKRTREKHTIPSRNSTIAPRKKFLPTDSISPLVVLRGRG